MKKPAGYILLAGCNCPEHIEAAKKYISDNGFTSSDVQMIGSNNPPFGEVLIVTKKEVELKV